MVGQGALASIERPVDPQTDKLARSTVNVGEHLVGCGVEERVDQGVRRDVGKITGARVPGAEVARQFQGVCQAGLIRAQRIGGEQVVETGVREDLKGELRPAAGVVRIAVEGILDEVGHAVVVGVGRGAPYAGALGRIEHHRQGEVGHQPVPILGAVDRETHRCRVERPLHAVIAAPRRALAHDAQQNRYNFLFSHTGNLFVELY